MIGFFGDCIMQVAIFLPRMGHCAAVAPEGHCVAVAPEGQNVYNPRIYPGERKQPHSIAPTGRNKIV